MGVHITRIVGITHTADDWRLYRDMEGREDCADRINRGVQTAINKAESRMDAWDAARKILEFKSNRRYGSADTEGWAVLEAIFEQVYGPED